MISKGPKMPMFGRVAAWPSRLTRLASTPDAEVMELYRPPLVRRLEVT